jgi:hypothetical protein
MTGGNMTLASGVRITLDLLKSRPTFLALYRRDCYLFGRFDVTEGWDQPPAYLESSMVAISD